MKNIMPFIFHKEEISFINSLIARILKSLSFNYVKIAVPVVNTTVVLLKLKGKIYDYLSSLTNMFWNLKH